MRTLSEGEILSLTGILSMEKDALAVARTMQSIITDEDLRKQCEAGVMATEGRIRGIQQFISENRVIGSKEGF